MKPYIPKKLPIQGLDWSSYVALIGEASIALGRYDGILQNMPNPLLLLSPLSTQEAVMSSKIEGTQATLEDVMEYEADPQLSKQQNQDIAEITNYVEALSHAIESLSSKPINLNLLKRIHGILLDSVRGKDKARGEFRREQVHIGSYGTPLNKATYIPPPPEVVVDMMSNLEHYIHSEEKEKLVQLAIIHAQFEIIHPFLDGNGRVGRILIPLFLEQKGILSHPVFYISSYFDQHRTEYYDRLNHITSNDDWDGWIKFFLSALVEQAQVNTVKVKSILGMYTLMKRDLPRILKSRYTLQALDAIFYRPLFSVTEFARMSGIPKLSAYQIVKALQEREILRVYKKGAGRRPKMLLFNQLIEELK